MPTHRADIDPVEPTVEVPTGPATQVKHPWRSTVRTVLWGLVAFAAMSPLIYEAATHQDPGAAVGWVATALAILAGIQRVMTLPVMDAFLRQYVPWLAAIPKTEERE